MLLRQYYIVGKQCADCWHVLFLLVFIAAYWAECFRVDYSLSHFVSAARRQLLLQKKNAEQQHLKGRYGGGGAAAAAAADTSPVTGVGWAGFYSYPAELRGYPVAGFFPTLKPGYGSLSFENYALGYYTPYYTGYLNQGYGSTSGYRPYSSGGYGNNNNYYTPSSYGGAGSSLGYRSNTNNNNNFGYTPYGRASYPTARMNSYQQHPFWRRQQASNNNYWPEQQEQIRQQPFSLNMI